MFICSHKQEKKIKQFFYLHLVAIDFGKEIEIGDGLAVVGLN